MRDYLGILFRRQAVVFTTIVTVVVTVYLGLILKTPVYEAQVKMLISAQKLVQAPNYKDLGDFRNNVEESQTQSEIVTSTPVIKRVVRALKLDQRPMDYEDRFASPLKRKLIGLMMKFRQIKLRRFTPQEQQEIILIDAIESLKKRVKVMPIPDTDMFTINVKDYSPTDAAVTANVLARSYVIFDLEQQLADLSIKYGDKQPNVLELKDNIDRMIQTLNGNPLSNIEAIGTATVKIIQQADIPMVPKGPSKFSILLLGFLMSIFLGVMIAFVVEYIDPTFKSPQQIKEELGLPFLGSVPRRRLGERSLILDHQRQTRYTQFYQVLCDHLYLLMKDNHLKSILITSAGSRESTSAVIANLGLYLSQVAGHQVLLLDANFRNPAMHKMFKVKNTAGFAEMIEGKEAFKDVAKELANNLHLVTTGQTGLNPVILLNSPKAQEVLEEFKKKFEIILVDCPNLMGFKDPVAMAGLTDASVVVVNEGMTRRQILKIALQPLYPKKINLLGVILNNRTFPIPKFVYERV